jgi:DNA repair protein RecN (Recombination protein N)
MLQTLHVRNIAIVEDAKVEFDPGLNVMTGETGAGKSVMLAALALVLGERADRTIIRAGETQCSVDATFDLKDPAPINATLEELGLPACEDGQLLVRRSLTAAGSGKTFVNNAPATVQALKQLGDNLVDMHGPHEHQALLAPDYQLGLLDAFGHLDEPRRAYSTAFIRLQQLQTQRAALNEGGTDTADLIELLTHQLTELDAAELETLDEAAVKHEHAAAANAQHILQTGGVVTQMLTESESAALTTLGVVQQQLESLRDMLEQVDEWKNEARAIAVRVQELAASIEQRLAAINADPKRMQWLDDRLTLLHRLKRKYGNSVPELIAYRDKTKTRLHDLEHRGEAIARIEKEIAAAREEVIAAGRKLGAARRKAAGKLATAVTSELRDLGFSHGGFDVKVETGEPQASGMDQVDFGFAPNAGEPMRPLRAIASSGEISRVMLALKAVLAAHDKIPVLVFDEIDANVGGETSVAVAAKLALVADRRQVLCITHLPQVAAQGATHIRVRKEVRDGRTYTNIERLDASTRVEEVARMLGGRDLTSVTIRHAKELLRQSAAGRKDKAE